MLFARWRHYFPRLIQINYGMMQSYFRNENENEKSGENHTAILCQPAVTQQCEHHLASSSVAVL